jgi:hypothetical protein
VQAGATEQALIDLFLLGQPQDAANLHMVAALNCQSSRHFCLLLVAIGCISSVNKFHLALEVRRRLSDLQLGPISNATSIFDPAFLNCTCLLPISHNCCNMHVN